MKRDINKLKEEKFDVLVVGGGIHGVTIAREAALKGYKTAIIEMKDFGHATSANSLKIIHGGLRYLQQADIKRMRQSIRSRKIFQQLAPNLIQTIPFVIPTYGHGIMGKESMAVALRINDIISWDRNREISRENYIPGGKLISRKEMLKISPGIQKDGLNGGAVWYECLITNTERLTLECLLNVEEYDLVAANYVKALRFVSRENRVQGVIAQDYFRKEEFEINANIIVNAAGPWFGDIINLLPEPRKFSQPWSKAVNIVVNRRLFPDYAVGLLGSSKYDDQNTVINKGKRLYFFIPWQGQTMIGTSYKHYHGFADECRPEENDIVEILEEINTIYPEAKLTWEDVTFFHTGILPAAPSESTADADVQLEKHSTIIDHYSTEDLEGLLSVRSVKFTTAPVIAEEVLKRISKRLRPDQVNRLPSSKQKMLPSDESGPHIVNDSSDVEDRLINTYGNRAQRILNLMVGDPSLADLICGISQITKAELLYLIREEMALTLDDVVMRRAGIGMLACPNEDSLKSIVNFMANELSWDESRKFDEIDKVLSHYSLLQRNEQRAVEVP